VWVACEERLVPVIKLKESPLLGLINREDQRHLMKPYSKEDFDLIYTLFWRWQKIFEAEDIRGRRYSCKVIENDLPDRSNYCKLG
jgi:hypothetical protein